MNRPIECAPAPGRAWRWRAVAAGLGAIAAVLLAAPPAQAADRVREAQWHLDYLKVAQAHKISQGAGVTVALVDTGVDADHRDLAGAVLKGKDFAILKADPPDGLTDLGGHGTAMAGLIAGRGHGNGDGVLGIAPKAMILPVRYADGIGDGDGERTSYSDMAIRWAAKQGVKVISMSFVTEPDDTLEYAIKLAREADIVLVGGVGNLPGPKSVQYPAAYEGVIAVGGVDQQGRHANFSVTGRRVDLTAPATDIMTTRIKGGYDDGDGTSHATAIVAGAAALIRAKYPHLSAEQVAHRLTSTAVDKGPKGRDSQYGHGVLDLVAALTADIEGESPPPGPATSAPNTKPVAGTPEDDSGIPTTAIVIFGAGLVLATLAAGIAWMLISRRT